ncbi:hypothetical protein Tco_0346220, partial [Tanacetum coccineum]
LELLHMDLFGPVSVESVNRKKYCLVVKKDSPFHLEAFSDSDYAGDNHDRRSTSGGCQYLLFDDENGVDCFPKQVIWDTLRDIGYEEEQSTSPHSRAAGSARVAQGTPTQSAAHSQRTASVQGTASFQDASQTSGGDEGLLDIYALNREVRRLKKQLASIY